jgi:hypothetical protein
MTIVSYPRFGNISIAPSEYPDTNKIVDGCGRIVNARTRFAGTDLVDGVLS